MSFFSLSLIAFRLFLGFLAIRTVRRRYLTLLYLNIHYASDKTSVVARYYYSERYAPLVKKEDKIKLLLFTLHPDIKQQSDYKYEPLPYNLTPKSKASHYFYRSFLATVIIVGTCGWGSYNLWNNHMLEVVIGYLVILGILLILYPLMKLNKSVKYWSKRRLGLINLRPLELLRYFTFGLLRRYTGTQWNAWVLVLILDIMILLILRRI